MAYFDGTNFNTGSDGGYFDIFVGASSNNDPYFDLFLNCTSNVTLNMKSDDGTPALLKSKNLRVHLPRGSQTKLGNFNSGFEGPLSTTYYYDYVFSYTNAGISAGSNKITSPWTHAK